MVILRFLGCGSGGVYVVRLANHLRDIARYDERRDVIGSFNLWQFNFSNNFANLVW